MTKHEGPQIKLKIDVSCSSCQYHESKYWCVENGNDFNSGFNHFCHFGKSFLGPKLIGDTAQTPDWCTFLKNKPQKMLDLLEPEMQILQEMREEIL